MIKTYSLIDRIDKSGLLACHFSGLISLQTIEPLLDEIGKFEREYPKGFKRFSDLSAIDGIALSTSEVHQIAERRRREYGGPKVRSAIYAPDQLAFGMMRIYAAVVYPAAIEVEVFYAIPEAAEWLAVSVDDLKICS